MTQTELHNTVKPEDVACSEDYVYLMGKQIHSCPVCGKELIYSGNKGLETLNEHVFACGEDDKIAQKFCFVCGNKYCAANVLGFGWNSNGDFYTLGKYFSSKYINFKKGITASIGSWQRGYDEKIAWQKSRTFRLNIGPIFEPWGNSILMLDFELFPKNPLHWGVVIWWKSHWVMNFPRNFFWYIGFRIKKIKEKYVEKKEQKVRKKSYKLTARADVFDDYSGPDK
jgi:hypothetical protein